LKKTRPEKLKVELEAAYDQFFPNNHRAKNKLWKSGGEYQLQGQTFRRMNLATTLDQTGNPKGIVRGAGGKD